MVGVAVAVYAYRDGAVHVQGVGVVLIVLV